LAVEAKHRGLLNSVQELISRLEVEAGFRVAANVKAEALRRAGE
jgi:predicted nucleic acid-binding protein